MHRLVKLDDRLVQRRIAKGEAIDDSAEGDWVLVDARTEAPVPLPVKASACRAAISMPMADRAARALGPRVQLAAGRQRAKVVRDAE